jgi:hypothetical protein
MPHKMPVESLAKLHVVATDTCVPDASDRPIASRINVAA